MSIVVSSLTKFGKIRRINIVSHHSHRTLPKRNEQVLCRPMALVLQTKLWYPRAWSKEGRMHQLLAQQLFVVKIKKPHLFLPPLIFYLLIIIIFFYSTNPKFDVFSFKLQSAYKQHQNQFSTLVLKNYI